VKLAHIFSRQVLDYTFHCCIFCRIGRGGHQYRPPDSPNLTPFFFFPCSTLYYYLSTETSQYV